MIHANRRKHGEQNDNRNVNSITSQECSMPEGQ